MSAVVSCVTLLKEALGWAGSHKNCFHSSSIAYCDILAWAPRWWVAVKREWSVSDGTAELIGEQDACFCCLASVRTCLTGWHWSVLPSGHLSGPVMYRHNPLAEFGYGGCSTWDLYLGCMRCFFCRPKTGKSSLSVSWLPKGHSWVCQWWGRAFPQQTGSWDHAKQQCGTLAHWLECLVVVFSISMARKALCSCRFCGFSHILLVYSISLHKAMAVRSPVREVASRHWCVEWSMMKSFRPTLILGIVNHRIYCCAYSLISHLALVWKSTCAPHLWCMCVGSGGCWCMILQMRIVAARLNCNIVPADVFVCGHLHVQMCVSSWTEQACCLHSVAQHTFHVLYIHRCTDVSGVQYIVLFGWHVHVHVCTLAHQ